MIESFLQYGQWVILLLSILSLALVSSVKHETRLNGYILTGISRFAGALDLSLKTKRLETPRVKIPKGSVGLTEQFCNIYSFESPGGWNIIGNTPINVFDKTNELRPNLINPGDTVIFNQISKDEHERHYD